MKKIILNFISRFWWVFFLIIFLLTFLKLTNTIFPYIGSDFPHLFERLLAGNWHIALQGFQPFYYSSYLCGGWIAYGHPEDVFYSLLQISAYYLDFWHAISVTVIINLIIGYAGWFFTGRHVLTLSKNWAHLFSLLILSNGFYLLHVLGGHWNFFAFPILGILIWCIFDKRHDTPTNILLKVCLFSLASGWALYSANYLVLLFWIMSTIVIFPIDLLTTKQKMRTRLTSLLTRVTVCSIGAMIICASKMLIAFSILNLYSRHISLLWTFPSTLTLRFAFLSFFAYPLSASKLEFIPGLLQEKSFLLSPVILIGLVCSVFVIASMIKNKALSNLRFIILALYLLLITVAFIQIISGNGLITNLVHSFPILSSQRVYIRFLYIPSLLLTALATVSLEKITIARFARYKNEIVIILAAVTVLTFYLGHLPAIYKQETLFNYNPSIKRTYNEHLTTMKNLSQSNNLPSPVTKVKKGRADFAGATGLTCGDSLLLWADSSALHRKVLRPGPTTDQQDNYYNIMKPACYIFPKVNYCQPGDRVPVSDQENMINFTSGKKVSWAVPLRQKIVNWLSLAWAITCLFTITIVSTRRFVRQYRKLLTND